MNAVRGVLALSAALALSACSSSGKDSSSSTPAGPAASGVPTDAAGLSALVTSAVADITSAHIEVGVNLSAQQLSGGGAEQLSHGNLVALDITEELAGVGDIRIIYADGKTYAKLPAALNSGPKPYLLVTPTSSNTTIRTLAPALNPVLSAVTLGSPGVLASAASSVKVEGTEQVGGVSTTHYSLLVDVARLPDSFPAKAQLVASGSGTMPLELYIDEKGRPAKIEPHVTVQGQDVPITATFSDYNKPVAIKAPPAGQVGS